MTTSLSLAAAAVVVVALVVAVAVVGAVVAFAQGRWPSLPVLQYRVPLGPEVAAVPLD